MIVKGHWGKSCDLFGTYMDSQGDPGGQRENGALGMALSNESKPTCSLTVLGGRTDFKKKSRIYWLA